MKWNIKSILKEVLIVGVMVFVLSNLISYVRRPTLNTDQLPQIKATLISGNQYIQKNNKPLVLHFWATWCPTCKLEAPNLETVSKNYEVLTIAVQSGSDDKIKAYMKENHLNFQVINDANGKWAKQFNIEAYPTTFIYNAKGKLQFSEVGYTSIAGLLARVKMAK